MYADIPTIEKMLLPAIIISCQNSLHEGKDLNGSHRVIY